MNGTTITKEVDLNRKGPNQALDQPKKGVAKMFQASGAGGGKLGKPIKNMAMSLADKTKRKFSAK